MIENNIAVTAQTATLIPQAQALALQLNLPLVVSSEKDFEYLLVFNEQHLEIRQTSINAPGAVYIDFLAGKLGYRRAHTFIRDELLAKAIGAKGNLRLTVIDATAGLGRDAFIMACLGCHVTLLERSPIMHALLEDGIRRLQSTLADSDKLDLILKNCNSIEYLANLTASKYPDIIYLDPMYPHRTKSAAVKKEMRLLREVVGDDLDADELLTVALLKAKKRVVVKRPRLAPELKQLKPDFAQIGKQHRFDVYLCKGD